MMDRCLVRFLPDDKKVKVPKGTDVLNAAIAAGVYINSSLSLSEQGNTSKWKTD